MKKCLIIIPLVLSFCLWTNGLCAEKDLTLFCGAGFKKPIEEIVDVFEKKTDTKVNALYAGHGSMFSQMLFSKQGDVFIVPSPNMMDMAAKKGVIVPGSAKGMAFVVPSINVQKGNPKNIKGLKDLLKPGVKVGFANPEIVYIGALAVEIAEKSLSEAEQDLLKKNIVTYAEDINKLATLLILKQVDAIIGFHYLEGWYPDKIETVKLRADEINRIGSALAAIISYTKDKKKAQELIDFIASDEGKPIFKKYNYFGSAEEAFAWIGAKKPIGGEYTVPAGWMKK
jgi:molybdate transport system substrate-binding protein